MTRSMSLRTSSPSPAPSFAELSSDTVTPLVRVV
jgi:hypothetical protein